MLVVRTDPPPPVSKSVFGNRALWMSVEPQPCEKFPIERRREAMGFRQNMEVRRGNTIEGRPQQASLLSPLVIIMDMNTYDLKVCRTDRHTDIFWDS